MAHPSCDLNLTVSNSNNSSTLRVQGTNPSKVKDELLLTAHRISSSTLVSGHIRCGCSELKIGFQTTLRNASLTATTHLLDTLIPTRCSTMAAFIARLDTTSP